MGTEGADGLALRRFYPRRLTGKLDVLILEMDVFIQEVKMRVKREHLRRRGKITLSVPPEDMPFIESLMERFPNVPFSRLVIEALREKFGEKGALSSLGGSLKDYSRGYIEDMEWVLREVAANAAQEGLDPRH